MPIYEYECEDQGHRFEKWQSIQDEPVKTCPVCGSQVHKVFHPAGLIFKGSGWYITDNRKAPGNSEKSEGPKAEGKSEPPSTEKKASAEKKD